jgi:hypothetical protein
MESLENNKTLAIFLGWEILSKPIDPNYPKQEWWISKNTKQNIWDFSGSVMLDDENVETKRAELFDRMWQSLCDFSYGRGGRYTTNWSKIQVVVDEIEKLGYNVVIERDFVSIKMTSDSPKYYENSIAFTLRYITKLQGLYLLCVEFVNFYNKNLKE